MIAFGKLWPSRAEDAQPPIFLEWRSSKVFIIFVVVFAVFTVGMTALVPWCLTRVWLMLTRD